MATVRNKTKNTINFTKYLQLHKDKKHFGKIIWDDCNCEKKRHLMWKINDTLLREAHNHYRINWKIIEGKVFQLVYRDQLDYNTDNSASKTFPLIKVGSSNKLKNKQDLVNVKRIDVITWSRQSVVLNRSKDL